MNEGKTPEKPASAVQPLRHVAIIMDGNGRWAAQQGLPRIEGHRRGVENLREVLKTARELELEFLTLFAFSVENWRRPRSEIDALMELLADGLRRHEKLLYEHQIRLRIVGRLQDLPRLIRGRIEKVVRKTAGFTRHNLVIALNYGSRTEIVDAVRAYVEAVREGRADPEELDWESFSGFLYTAGIPDPDLLIRTSGESRLSNFLMLQMAYTELVFAPVHWPAFDRQAFLDAVEVYRQRERRFGMTAEQLRAEADGKLPALSR